MQTFLKLNFISILYALTLFIQTELMVNVYRLERLSGLTELNTFVDYTNIVIFVIAGIILFYLTKHLLGYRKVKYLISVLWIPYFYIFIHSFAYLFPFTDPQEEPLPGLGLLIIGMVIIFPFYAAFINSISTLTLKHQFHE